MAPPPLLHIKEADSAQDQEGLHLPPGGSSSTSKKPMAQVQEGLHPWWPHLGRRKFEKRPKRLKIKKGCIAGGPSSSYFSISKMPKRLMIKMWNAIALQS